MARSKRKSKVWTRGFKISLTIGLIIVAIFAFSYFAITMEKELIKQNSSIDPGAGYYNVIFVTPDQELITNQTMQSSDALLLPNIGALLPDGFDLYGYRTGNTTYTLSQLLNYKVMKDTQFTAVFISETVQLTYVDWDNSVWYQTSFNFGDTIPQPPTTPTRTGYNFVGWTRIDDAFMITFMIFQAQYDMLTHDITFTNGIDSWDVVTQSGTMPDIPDMSIPGFDLIGFDKPVVPAFADTTYFAQYDFADGREGINYYSTPQVITSVNTTFNTKDATIDITPDIFPNTISSYLYAVVYIDDYEIYVSGGDFSRGNNIQVVQGFYNSTNLLFSALVMFGVSNDYANTSSDEFPDIHFFISLSYSIVNRYVRAVFYYSQIPAPDIALGYIHNAPENLNLDTWDYNYIFTLPQDDISFTDSNSFQLTFEYDVIEITYGPPTAVTGISPHPSTVATIDLKDSLVYQAPFTINSQTYNLIITFKIFKDSILTISFDISGSSNKIYVASPIMFSDLTIT